MSAYRYNMLMFKSSVILTLPEYRFSVTRILQKSPPKVFCEKRWSGKFRKTHRKTPVLESLFNKIADYRPATLLKENPTQVFSVEFCELFKNSFCTEHLRATVKRGLNVAKGGLHLFMVRMKY